MGYLKTILLLSLVFIAAATANPTDARANYGAYIVATNCDPAADFTLDSSAAQSVKDTVDGKDYYPLKSCVGQNIRYDEFKVKVQFHPTDDYIGMYAASNLPVLMVLFSPVYWPAAEAARNSYAAGVCAYLLIPVPTPGYPFCVLANSMTPTALMIGRAAGTAAVVAAVTVTVAVIVAAEKLHATFLDLGGDGTATKYILVGDTQSLLDGWAPAPMPMAAATVALVNDKACVTMQSRPMIFLNFVADRSDGTDPKYPNLNFNKNYKIETVSARRKAEQEDFAREKGADSNFAGLPSNCVYMPQPPKAIKPAVPSFVSQTCVDYDTSASQFFWPIDPQHPVKHTRSFVGVVVQCVEDTMTNLFFNARGTDSQTVFVKMQKQLQTYVMAMLTLYIIMLGYKHGIMERGGIKNPDFIWAILKVSLVMFFASGAGMSQLLPEIVGTVKNLSALVLDASAGPSGDKVAAEAAQKTAYDDYMAKSKAYAAARKLWGLNTNGSNAATLKVAMDNAKVAMDDANAKLQKANTATLSFGYNYCDFRDHVTAGKYNVFTTYKEDTTIPYTSVKPDGTVVLAGTVVPKGTTLARDMSTMHIWDSIDCRISKYLGIGSDINTPSAPQFLLLALGMILGGPVGLIIFALSIIFLIFVILITVRVVQIYIISFIAIILLVYISPLIFPLVLFDYTKSSFDTWLRQMISYMVQPIILFGFLAFMFAVFDSLIWGKNYEFYKPTASDLATNNYTKLTDNTIKKVKANSNGAIVACAADDTVNCVCPDEDTIGCMFENMSLTKNSISINNHELLTTYGVIMKKNAAVADENAEGNASQNNAALVEEFARTHQGHGSSVGALSDTQRNTYMIALMKAVFICFVINALLGQIETISETLTNAASSAARMATVPAAGPQAISAAAVAPLASGALKIAKGAAGGADKAMKNAAEGTGRGGVRGAVGTAAGVALGALTGGAKAAPGAVAGAAAGVAKGAAKAASDGGGGQSDLYKQASAANPDAAGGGEKKS